MSARDQSTYFNVGCISAVQEGRRFMQQRLGQEVSDRQVLTHRLYALPFIVGENTPTINRIGVFIASAVQSITLRMALYTKTSSNNLWPGQFLLDCNCLYLGNAGPTVNSISFVASANDLLWVAFVTSHASPGGSVPSLKGGKIIGPIFGVSANWNLNETYSALYVSSGDVTAAFPATFPTSQGVMTDQAQPIVQFA